MFEPAIQWQRGADAVGGQETPIDRWIDANCGVARPVAMSEVREVELIQLRCDAEARIAAEPSGNLELRYGELLKPVADDPIERRSRGWLFFAILGLTILPGSRRPKSIVQAVPMD